MKTRAGESRRWLTVVLFAIAMAWVESAVVFDLRTMVDRIEPYQPRPLPLVGKLGPVELVREFATLVMLFTVGVLAGKTWRARVGYMLIAFGVWDIPASSERGRESFQNRRYASMRIASTHNLVSD